jgi:putative effector of murein hydrolase LrgA (UPF0299 family)
MSTMWPSIAACAAAFWVLVWVLRRERVSLGLPIAYLFGLLLIHVPGALAHALGASMLRDSDLTAMGIKFTAIAAVCFVFGVSMASRGRRRPGPSVPANRSQFALFCLVGGWLFTYGLASVSRIPSVGAAVQKGGAIWMLGVLLGVRAALRRGDAISTAFWLAALAVYPVLMLLLGGFLSYGSAAIIVVLSSLVISIRSPLRVAAGIVVVALFAFNGFVNYFQHRDDIREAVWYGASLSDRVDVSLDVFRDFEWFDPGNAAHLMSLDLRLNQNYFVGLAAARIAEGDVDYLHGRSLWEGVQALVPRILWADKPVFAGSPRIVAEMTGLTLSDTTSWGVGNVMEFQINFGLPGVIVGFLGLGWLLRTLDRKAAAAEADGHVGRMFFLFLPAAALIQPNGSLVELAGGSAASLVAAVGWNWVWTIWSGRHTARAPMRMSTPTRGTL